MRISVLVSSALLILLCGCTLGKWVAGEAQPEKDPATAPYYDYTEFFRAFENPWVGRSREELVAARGQPDAIFEARHQFADFDAGIPAATYIYVGKDNNAGPCIDAYVVDEPTQTVIKYYCR